MQCQRCGERPAVIHLTTIVDNTHTEQHLCEACAAQQGIQTEASLAKFPVGDLLDSLSKGAATQLPASETTARCTACGATLQDFRETGRLGCARCYAVFEAPLRTLLRRVHGASRHMGEPYVSPGGAAAGDEPGRAAADAPDLSALREQMQRAVETENFELAARLRDEIRGRE
jgi:protein arginine kinase activator